MIMTRDEAIALTAGRDMWSTADLPDTPSARMADGPMGIASGRVDERDVSVLTPCGMALGATFDRDLVRKVGAIVGGEAKRLGVDMILAPNINLVRTPLAGRAFELFGEDPLLAGTLGAVWIEGLQSRHVGAVAKHLVCNDSETMRDSYDAQIDEKALREVYLLPFEMAARVGCAGMLAAYNRVNGVYCAEQDHVLTRVLRDDWGYQGFTVSDWFGSKSTAPAMMAGLDLEMPGPARFYGQKLSAAIDAGELDEQRLLTAADRVATAARRWSGGDAGAEPGDRATMLADAAAASFVLLENRGDLLPMVAGRHRTIAVIGPNAAAPCFQGGTFAKVALRPDAIGLVDALRARYGEETQFLFEPGTDPTPRLPAMPALPAQDIGDGCTRGMTVSFFDGHDFSGAPLFQETRDTNSLTWFAGMPGMDAFDRPAGVRAAGRFTAPVSGDYRLHIGGTGSVTLRVDGAAVYSESRSIAPGDIMGVLKNGDSDHVVMALEEGRTYLIEAELRFEPARAQGLWYGIATPGNPETLFVRAEVAARQADAVLLVVGETSDSGVESKDRDTSFLSPEQIELTRRVCAANPTTAIIANVAHAIDTDFAADATALMIVWYPGEEFGPALASVLAGDREPSGRLPVSFAADESHYPVFNATPAPDGSLPYEEGTKIGYRGFTETPAYAFGAGRGYGAFTLIDAKAIAPLSVAVSVRNDAPRASAFVAQLYRVQDGALIGFAKQVIAAGETAILTVIVDPIALRRWTDAGWHMPDGPVATAIGASSIDLPLRIDLPVA
jgi:beta-glucosidase